VTYLLTKLFIKRILIRWWNSFSRCSTDFIRQ